MQKKNSVIKNYILSPEKFMISGNTASKTTEISLYHVPLKQNKESVFLFLLRK